MQDILWKNHIQSYDDRRDIAILADENALWDFATAHWVQSAQEAIAKRGVFAVALSGGNTPKVLFKRLAHVQLDWKSILLFWSDERALPPSDPESNYAIAMQGGLQNLPIPKENIFRMPADHADLEEGAHQYEQILKMHLPHHKFDLVMLGMGEDGHIASLFPETHALHDKDHLVTANYVPQKSMWRLTLTYKGIHQSNAIALYVLGENKAPTLAKVLMGPYEPDRLPAQRVGMAERKALWIVDRAAASLLVKE